MLAGVGWSTSWIRHSVEVLLTGCCSIIFVHGLGSNPDTTWTVQTQPSKSTATDIQRNISWISEFLPQDLPPSIRENTRVFFYNHDSYWQRDAVQTRLWSLGEGLLQRIRINIRNTEDVGLSYLSELDGAAGNSFDRSESATLSSWDTATEA